MLQICILSSRHPLQEILRPDPTHRICFKISKSKKGKGNSLLESWIQKDENKTCQIWEGNVEEGECKQEFVP